MLTNNLIQNSDRLLTSTNRRFLKTCCKVHNFLHDLPPNFAIVHQIPRAVQDKGRFTGHVLGQFQLLNEPLLMTIMDLNEVIQRKGAFLGPPSCFQASHAHLGAAPQVYETVHLRFSRKISNGTMEKKKKIYKIMK